MKTPTIWIREIVHQQMAGENIEVEIDDGKIDFRLVVANVHKFPIPVEGFEKYFVFETFDGENVKSEVVLH